MCSPLLVRDMVLQKWQLLLLLYYSTERTPTSELPTLKTQSDCCALDPYHHTEVYWCIRTSQLLSPSLFPLIQRSRPEPLGQPEIMPELRPCGNPHSDMAGWTPADAHSSHKLLMTNCKWRCRTVDAIAMGDMKCERCALFVIVK